MIPYDDLVAALSAWRARQGLPVSMDGGGSGATPKVGSGPHAAPGSGPNRAAPPSPPPGRMQAQAETEEVVDDAAMLDEEAYENEGNDFAMAFGAGGGADAGEATSIGAAPERPTEADLGRDRDDW